MFFETFIYKLQAGFKHIFELDFGHLDVLLVFLCIFLVLFAVKKVLNFISYIRYIKTRNTLLFSYFFNVCGATSASKSRASKKAVDTCLNLLAKTLKFKRKSLLNKAKEKFVFGQHHGIGHEYNKIIIPIMFNSLSERNLILNFLTDFILSHGFFEKKEIKFLLFLNKLFKNDLLFLANIIYEQSGQKDKTEVFDLSNFDTDGTEELDDFLMIYDLLSSKTHKIKDARVAKCLMPFYTKGMDEQQLKKEYMHHMFMIKNEKIQIYKKYFNFFEHPNYYSNNLKKYFMLKISLVDSAFQYINKYNLFHK